MGMSIYYAASRNQPLSPGERVTIERMIAAYSIRDQVEHYSQTHEGHNGEDFDVYDSNRPTTPDAVFEGATRLPDTSEDALWEVLQHWCELLSEIRRVLPNASWRVNVDDHDIVWDESRQAYDPAV